MLTVRFFAALRDITGHGEVTIQAPALTTVSEVFTTLQARYPQLAGYRRVLLVAVNQEYAQWEQPLSDGDEVAFFPPVSGGRGRTSRPIRVQTESSRC